MSKKWSQFDPFTALTGTEEIVGLQGGTNKRGAVNGVFKNFFDDLYWPLGGAAELTGALSVDGDGNTLDFIDLGGFSVDVGVNNMGFTGSVLSLEATNSIVWNVDDGVDVTDIDIDPNSVTAATTDIHLNTTNSFNVSADDGVDSSSFSLTPLGASFDRPIQLAPYTVATLPVTAEAGLFAFCIDESGGEVPVFTNNSGTWLRVTDGSPPS